MLVAEADRSSSVLEKPRQEFHDPSNARISSRRVYPQVSASQSFGACHPKSPQRLLMKSLSLLPSAIRSAQPTRYMNPPHTRLAAVHHARFHDHGSEVVCGRPDRNPLRHRCGEEKRRGEENGEIHLHPRDSSVRARTVGNKRCWFQDQTKGRRYESK